MITVGLAAPNIINGGEGRGSQVLRHGVVSILTCADIYSSFSPETRGDTAYRWLAADDGGFSPADVIKCHTHAEQAFLQRGSPPY